jgi:hypothetical protein
MGACAQDRSASVASAASTILRRARRAQPSIARLLVGGLATTPRRGRGGKSRGRQRATQKMLKTEVDPEMYMKTKDHVTMCPTQKTTFLPSCTPFYTKTHVFCRNRRLFCHYSSVGERTGRFKMEKLEGVACRTLFMLIATPNEEGTASRTRTAKR